jgi:hypothetical protein
MSSLQQQLSAIGRNATAQLDLEVQRVQHGKSLLWNAREAMDQDFTTIYNACAAGFQALVEQDPSTFSPIQESLYGPATISLDRAQLSAEENKKLDTVLTIALERLSPFLLRSEGQLAVEWLIRRFK